MGEGGIPGLTFPKRKKTSPLLCVRWKKKAQNLLLLPDERCLGERRKKGGKKMQPESISEPAKGQEEPEIDIDSFICGYIYHEISKPPGIKDTETVLNLLEKVGIDRKTAIKAIKTLKSEGHVYEANKGQLGALWDKDTFKG